MSKKRKKQGSKPAIIHHPYQLEALMTSEEVGQLKRRVNRRLGSCGECHKPLGRTQDLAMVVASANVEDLATMAGTWHITLTHRACRKEAVLDQAMLAPQHTYTTTLVAIPVISTEGLPQQVPTLLINPSIDHFTLFKDRRGPMRDFSLKYLQEEVGFARMAEDSDDTPESDQLEAYVTGTNITVAANDHAMSWTHEQAGDPATLDHLSENLRALLESWDDTLMVMVSTKFRASNPNQMMRDLPDLIRNGDVISAPAKVQYRESNASLVSKAFAAATSADG